jgi:phosphatidylglycerophosphate synthase
VRHPVIILADSPGALTELCGISLLERLLRTLQRLGLRKTIVLSATPDLLAPHLADPSRHRAMVSIDLRRRTGGRLDPKQIAEVWPNDADAVMVILGDSVFDSRLLQLLDDQSSRTTILVDSAPPAALQSLVASSPNATCGRFCGAALLSEDWVKSHDGPMEQALLEEVEAGEVEVVDIAGRDWYHASMRRRSHPTWFPVPLAKHARIARRALIKAAGKGSLDFPAMVHSPIENFLINHLCRSAITPNQLTALTNLVAWGATFLFVTGRLGWGAILALAVGILDGLDGKQARVKVETSKIGKLEHWFDAFFEHSWWIAIAYSLQSSGRLPGAFVYLLILMGAEAVAGLSKLSVFRACGRTLDELGDFNRIVRLIGGRRNVYIWLFALGVLLGRSGQAFAFMAVWAAATAFVQVLRASFAVRAHRVGRMPSEVPAEA